MIPLGIHDIEYMSQPLCDDVFQDWLRYHSLLIQTDSVETLLENAILLWLQQGRSFKKNEFRMLKALDTRAGKLMPHGQVSQYMFPSSERENPIFDWMRINQTGMQIQRKQQDLIYYAKLLGWGLGVQEFHLHVTSVPLLYAFWLSQLQPLAQSKLAEMMTGKNDSDSIVLLRKQVMMMNDVDLINSDLEVHEDTQANQTYYRLQNRSIQFETNKDLQFDLYTIRSFQDWLFAFGFIERRLHTVSRLSTVQPQTKEHHLISCLIANSGYIIPYSYLGEFLYGSDVRAMSKIGRMVTELKQKKIIAHKEVYAVPGYGIGLGVDAVSCTNKQLQLLQLLWNGQSYSTQQILASLWGIYPPFDTNELYKVRTLIDTTRTLLEHTPYTVARFGDWRKYRFSLQEKEK